jgi:hypothetical protein
MIDATQKAHNGYQQLGKSQYNIARIPYIENFHPINCAYGNLITRSLKAETQYSPNQDPQKADKSVDQCTNEMGNDERQVRQVQQEYSWM